MFDLVIGGTDSVFQTNYNNRNSNEDVIQIWRKEEK